MGDTSPPGRYAVRFDTPRNPCYDPLLERAGYASHALTD
jgi:hypothetical protein